PRAPHRHHETYQSRRTHTMDFSDEIIKDNLIRGLADPEILSNLLGDSKIDRTLEETTIFISQKEQGKSTKCAVEDHAILGFPMADTSKLPPINIPMIADSGCQSSIVPLRSAQSMGFGKEDKIPVRLIMRGAIKEDLGVTGAVVTDVSTTGTSGTPRSTRQLIYIPSNLPPGLTATKNNLPALKEWLLDYYGATAFNVCEHQPLPMMTCEPLQLFVDPDVRPVDFHKPALVPKYWREKVYQDLERDVRMGVLEKVDPNTPAT
ncbi:hypothetical protein EGW08_023479, partial [Elysia chlorotica]